MKKKMKNSKKIAIAFMIFLSIFLIITILCMISENIFNSCTDAKGITGCGQPFCNLKCQTPFYTITHLLWIIMIVLIGPLTPIFLILFFLCYTYEKNKEKNEKNNNKQ